MRIPVGVTCASTTSPTGSAWLCCHEQRQRQREQRPAALDDVAAAIGGRRRRDAVDLAELEVDRLEFERREGAVEHGVPTQDAAGLRRQGFKKSFRLALQRATDDRRHGFSRGQRPPDQSASNRLDGSRIVTD